MEAICHQAFCFFESPFDNILADATVEQLFDFTIKLHTREVELASNIVDTQPLIGQFRFDNSRKAIEKPSVAFINGI
ncbi:hypothetical protein D3C73_1045710 [compost metagenome]